MYDAYVVFYQKNNLLSALLRIILSQLNSFQMGLTLNWGVAGVGMISHDFLTAMVNLPAGQHKVIAIAGKDVHRVNRLAMLHNINRAYEGYESLAHDSSIGN